MRNATVCSGKIVLTRMPGESISRHLKEVLLSMILLIASNVVKLVVLIQIFPPLRSTILLITSRSRVSSSSRSRTPCKRTPLRSPMSEVERGLRSLRKITASNVGAGSSSVTEI